MRNLTVRLELAVDPDTWRAVCDEEPTPGHVAEWVVELVEFSKLGDRGAAKLVRLAVVAR